MTTNRPIPPLAGARWNAGVRNHVNLIVDLQRNRFANAYLDRFPIKRTTPSGVVYRVESVPSLVVANEVFATDDYIKPISLVRPRTFVDLGANVGYFPLMVAEITGSRTIQGLCIEPNPQLHRRLERHLEATGLRGVPRLTGLGAADEAGPEADFFLSPSHIASSLTGEFNPLLPPRGRVRKIRVPVIDLAVEWRRQFGDRRIDLIKIDIEGAEIAFLKAHPSFLARTDAILLEWHRWVTTLEEVSSVLAPSGFVLESVGKVDMNAGTALFRRKDEATADVHPS
jgi:FkbM family methyltransferase